MSYAQLQLSNSDNFVQGGRFAICDQSQHYDEHICNLTMQVMSEDELNEMSSADFFSDQIDEMMTEMKKICFYFIYIGLGIWFFGALQVFTPQ